MENAHFEWSWIRQRQIKMEKKKFEKKINDMNTSKLSVWTTHSSDINVEYTTPTAQISQWHKYTHRKHNSSIH